MLYLLLLCSAYSQSLFDIYYRYEDLTSELTEYSKNPSVSLVQIGQTVEGRAIPGLLLNSSSPMNTLVLGGLHPNQHASTLQVMQNIRISLKNRSLLQANTWFVPVLNVDSYVKIEEKYAQTSSVPELSKNQRKFNCAFTNEMGVNLNRNFDTSNGFPAYDPCDLEYQGPSPFSEPESAALKNLVETVDFQLILVYLTGGHKYVAPTYQNNDILNTVTHVTEEDVPGSFLNYGADRGIVSLAGYISEENRPWPAVNDQSAVFLEIQSRLGPSIVYWSTYNLGELLQTFEIYVENTGFFALTQLSVVIESSVRLPPSTILVFYGSELKKTVEWAEGKQGTVVLETLQSLEEARIFIEFEDYVYFRFRFDTPNVLRKERAMSSFDVPVNIDLRTLLIIIGANLIVFLGVLVLYKKTRFRHKSRLLMVPKRLPPEAL